MTYELYYTNQAKKDYQKLKTSNLNEKVLLLLDIIKNNPYQSPPPFEMLSGDLKGAASRRLNKQHRLVYEVIEEQKSIKVIRMWTHYE